MRVAIASDHGGYGLKADLKRLLSGSGHIWIDFGCDRVDPVDYPDYAVQVADAVATGLFERGIIMDGVGIGSAIVANKVPGVRAAPCHTVAVAISAREHSDANVLTLGGGLVDAHLAAEIVGAFLATPFAGGRHQRRIDKLRAIEFRHLLDRREA